MYPNFLHKLYLHEVRGTGPTVAISDKKSPLRESKTRTACSVFLILILCPPCLHASLLLWIAGSVRCVRVPACSSEWVSGFVCPYVLACVCFTPWIKKARVSLPLQAPRSSVSSNWVWGALPVTLLFCPCPHADMTPYLRENKSSGYIRAQMRNEVIRTGTTAALERQNDTCQIITTWAWSNMQVLFSSVGRAWPFGSIPATTHT